MRTRNTVILPRLAALLLIFAAIVLTLFSLVQYSRQRATYPAQMRIGGVPVGGLTPQEAADRLIQVYSTPIEIHYGDAVIQMSPSVAGFELDIETMLAAANMERLGVSFWGGFWDYLWQRPQQPIEIPLRATFSETRLRQYLQSEIAARYDVPPVPAQAIPASATFEPGQAGQELDIDRALVLIGDALRSPTNRVVNLSYRRAPAPPPGEQNLAILLQQIITDSGFDGVVGLYLLNLQSGAEIHFVLDNGREIPVPPDVAFTASSTIKIPIMISVFRFYRSQLDANTETLLTNMLKLSENPPADALMARLDETRGPLVVTENMRALGLENTFLAGYFYDGAPLLQLYQTPANQRTDVETNPDIYNQTTPSEMGSLLADLYACAHQNSGALLAAFPGEITQAGCQQMLDLLARDKIGVLIEAGVPEGTRVAHKHGWISGPNGVIQNISDAGVVYTPGGDYVLSIYTYHPREAIWNQVSTLIARISQAVYNYYNLPTE